MSSKDHLKEAMVDISTDVEKLLNRLIPDVSGDEKQLFDAMRYVVFAGGKRLRPFLVVASSEMFGVDRSVAMRTAAAIECVHSYSLVHDDLPAMDDDELRRGKLTAHLEFDEATAILAGDGLQTLAFEILADEASHPDPRVRLELIRTLAQASGVHGMVGGQMIDLVAENKTLDLSGITRLQQMKTGALICYSAEAGAILGKADRHRRHLLYGYAKDLGLAFQIADDLLDHEGDATAMGKATGKDTERGKATFVAHLGPERARQQARILADQAIEHLQEFGEKAALLNSLAHYVIDRQN